MASKNTHQLLMKERTMKTKFASLLLRRLLAPLSRHAETTNVTATRSACEISRARETELAKQRRHLNVKVFTTVNY